MRCGCVCGRADRLPHWCGLSGSDGTNGHRWCRGAELVGRPGAAVVVCRDDGVPGRACVRAPAATADQQPAAVLYARNDEHLSWQRRSGWCGTTGSGAVTGCGGCQPCRNRRVGQHAGHATRPDAAAFNQRFQRRLWLGPRARLCVEVLQCIVTAPAGRFEGHHVRPRGGAWAV